MVVCRDFDKIYHNSKHTLNIFSFAVKKKTLDIFLVKNVVCQFMKKVLSMSYENESLI
jgi:hypothetical protein